jgi:hypothetical protein
METMTRPKFAALAGGQHVDGCIIFDHGPDPCGHSSRHHEVNDKSVRYTLSPYPVFDSITITRLGPKRV